MTPAEARRALEETNAVISTVAMMLDGVTPTLERFMEEARHMDNVGHIIDPTLFMSPERQATEALLRPLYKAALDFSRLYKTQLAAAAGALEKVRA